MDAGACLLTRALLSFKRWGDETPQAGRFFAIFAGLLVELTIDNAFTWYTHSLVISLVCHVWRLVTSLRLHVTHAHDDHTAEHTHVHSICICTVVICRQPSVCVQVSQNKV